MGEQTHRIERQILEIEVDDPSDGKRLQEVLSRLQRQQFAAIIERTLDDFADPGTLLRIDRLTIDLGEIDSDGVEMALANSLRRELRAGLDRALLTGDVAGTPRPRRVDHHAAAVEELAFFARTGALPWSAAKRDARHLSRRLQEALKGSPRVLTQLLGELAQEPPALARLAAHFDDRTLAALVDLLLSPSRLRPLTTAGDASGAADEFAALLDAPAELPGRTSIQRHNLAWSGLLSAAAKHRPGAAATPAMIYEAALDEVSFASGQPLSGARDRLAALQREPRSSASARPEGPAEHILPVRPPGNETPTADDVEAGRAAALRVAAAAALTGEAPEFTDMVRRDGDAQSSQRNSRQDSRQEPRPGPRQGPRQDPQPANDDDEGSAIEPSAVRESRPAGRTAPGETGTADQAKSAEQRRSTSEPRGHTNLTPGSEGRVPPRAKAEARDAAASRASVEDTSAVDLLDPTKPRRRPHHSDSATRAPSDLAAEQAAKSEPLPLPLPLPPSAEDPVARRIIEAIATWSDAAERARALIRGEGGGRSGPPGPAAQRELGRLVDGLIDLGSSIEGVPAATLTRIFDASASRLPEHRESVEFSLMALAGRAAPKMSRETVSALTDSLTRHLERLGAPSRTSTGDSRATPQGTATEGSEALSKTQPQNRGPNLAAGTSERERRSDEPQRDENSEIQAERSAQQLPRPRPRPRPAKRREQAFVDSAHLHVDDAGLVILWPFLPHLFGHLDLLDGRHFRDANAQLRAAALLRVAAAGDEEVAEYQLPLAKLLCGLEVDEVFELDTPLTEVEIDESTRMLEALIARATVLKEMSVGGLRGSFLLRPGVLSIRDGSWFLRVENRPYDIVLGRFPWTFEWVKLPWMSAPIQVEW